MSVASSHLYIQVTLCLTNTHLSLYQEESTNLSLLHFRLLAILKYRISITNEKPKLISKVKYCKATGFCEGQSYSHWGTGALATRGQCTT